MTIPSKPLHFTEPERRWLLDANRFWYKSTGPAHLIKTFEMFKSIEQKLKGREK